MRGTGLIGAAMAALLAGALGGTGVTVTSTLDAPGATGGKHTPLRSVAPSLAEQAMRRLIGGGGSGPKRHPAPGWPQAVDRRRAAKRRRVLANRGAHRG